MKFSDWTERYFGPDSEAIVKSRHHEEHIRLLLEEIYKAAGEDLAKERDILLKMVGHRINDIEKLETELKQYKSGKQTTKIEFDTGEHHG